MSGAVALSREDAFEQEMLAQLDAVYRYALRLSGSSDEAADLAQETVLRALRARAHYTTGTNAKAWLLTIVRNAFLNRQRRARRWVEVNVDAADQRAVPGGAPPADPEAAFYEHLIDDEVLDAIDTLAPALREVVVLSDIEGLSHADASRVMGIPVGTVKSRLFRARRQLQGRLYHYAVEMGYVRETATSETAGAGNREASARGCAPLVPARCGAG